MSAAPARPHAGAAWLVAVVLGLIACPSAVTGQTVPLAQEVAGSAAQLQDLRRQITSVREELAGIAGQREDADRSLAQVTREIGLIRELLAGLDQRERILTIQRDSLQVDLAAQHATYEMRRRNLATRLRALYKQGPQRDLELIVTSESFSALVARLRFATILTRLDGNLVAQTRRQGQRIVDEQQHLQAALAGIWEAREEARLERERLELLEAERRGLLRELTQQEERSSAELARLRRQAQQLEDLLGRLEQQRQQQPERDRAPQRGLPFVDRRGDLPWPATGAVVREFGPSVHPRFGTVTMHNGLSIAVTPGAPVAAVAPGRVEFAEHLPGFGRCVIVDHGSGHYTLYGNLARVFASRGSQVDAGQILAEMGDDVAGQRPELYFEIREGRDARDPRGWLRPAR